MTWSNLFHNASACVKAYTAYSHMVVIIQHILCTQVNDTGPYGPLVTIYGCGGHLGHVIQTPPPPNKLSFPHPMEAPYEIWLSLAQRFWSVDDGTCLYYKLAHEPKGSGELKRHMGEFVTRRMTFEWEQPLAYIELCKLEEQDAQSIRGPKSVSLFFLSK